MHAEKSIHVSYINKETNPLNLSIRNLESELGGCEYKSECFKLCLNPTQNKGSSQLHVNF